MVQIRPGQHRRRILSRFLAVFFHLLYHQFAWVYDFVAAVVSLGRWSTWVASVLEELRGPQVLELGHGPGHLQKALFERGFQPVGIDASFQMGKLAKRRISASGRQPRLINSAANALPFPSEYFDEVVATFPTEYIDSADTLQEVHRVLKPGGTLVVLPMAWITGKSLTRRFAAWLFRVTGQTRPLSQAFEHRLVQPQHRAGFEVEVRRKTLPDSTLVLLLAKKMDKRQL